MKRFLSFACVFGLLFLLWNMNKQTSATAPTKALELAKHKNLSEQQVRVCLEAGTEPAFSGSHLKNKSNGIYTCVVCGHKLFSSKTKFKSGTGWPSFYDVENPRSVKLREDSSYGLSRTEVICGNCGAHLGHVFGDGPQPTGKRYCINSVCLNFAFEKK